MPQPKFEIPRDDEPCCQVIHRAAETGRLLLTRPGRWLIAPWPLRGWQVAGVCNFSTNKKGETPCTDSTAG